MTAPGKFALKIKDYIETPEGKREYNEQHFGEAAKRYDLATRGMSFGQDRRWKELLVDTLPPVRRALCVDLACGTGDVTFMLAGKYPDGHILGIDLTQSMLDLAEQRNNRDNVDFVRQDISAIELPDGYADVVTGSYAVRNAPDLRQVFAEISRILRPGGTVALLDFSKPPWPAFQRLQFLILKYWCGFWGLLLHGNPEVHSYIAESLKRYPDREQLQALVQEAGFTICRTRRFYLGTLELLVLQKAHGPDPDEKRNT